MAGNGTWCLVIVTSSVGLSPEEAHGANREAHGVKGRGERLHCGNQNIISQFKDVIYIKFLINCKVLYQCD